jgi:hypothetical protein
MSTKIYDMYKYHRNISELMVWLKKFRRAYERTATREISFMLGSGAWRPESDRGPLYGESGHLNYFVLMDMLKAEIKRGMNEPFNINFSAVVYPHKRTLFVQFFGLDFGLRYYSKWLRQHIDNNDKFEDYSYWDNTDPPDGISYSTWRKRGKLFDRIFSKFHFFNSNGLVYEMSNDESLLNISRHVAIWRDRNNEVNRKNKEVQIN